MGEKVSKTNAARLLDRAKIHYELIPYRVDEDDLAAVHSSSASRLSACSRRSCCAATGRAF